MYTVLGVAITFPLIFRLSTNVAGDLVDPLFITSLLWWNAHVVPLTERWWNGFAFYPTPGMMAFSDHLIGESLMATPLQWLGLSATTAYNLTLIATFPLCAFAAHLFGYALTKRHLNHALAAHFWPNESAVGKRLRQDYNTDWVTIAGVVGDVRYDALDTLPDFEVYLPDGLFPEVP